MELAKISNEATMSSVEIAEYLGKQHKNVLQVCDKFFKDNNLQPAEFSARYNDKQGKPRKCYEFNKDYSLAIVAIIDNSHLMAIIKRWQELESGAEVISTDPIIAMRQNQIRIEKRLDRIEEVTEVLAIEEKRALTKEEPPKGFANKGDVMKTVSGILGTTKSIVEQVLYFYEEDIETSQYAIEAMSADAIINVDVKCYRVTEVLKSVLDAINNSKEVTACFSVFPTLGQKKLKVK